MTLLILILIFFDINIFGQNKRIELSIIEQRFEGWNLDTINPFILRFCFYKEKNHWYIADDSLRTRKGNVCFDGKLIGKIDILELYNKTKCETCKYMFDDTHYIIRDCKNVPKVGKPSTLFSGWILDRPVYRPLVVNSTPNFKDNEHWRPFTPSKRDSLIILKFFKGKILPKKYLNKKDNQLFKNINKSYISSDSIRLISTNLFGDYKYPCDTCEGVIQETGQNSWFVLKKDNIDYIDSDMILVDAGDYDNDGKSEIIFMKQQYDYDAYILLYDLKFEKEIGWRYH